MTDPAATPAPAAAPAETAATKPTAKAPAKPKAKRARKPRATTAVVLRKIVGNLAAGRVVRLPAVKAAAAIKAGKAYEASSGQVAMAEPGVLDLPEL